MAASFDQLLGSNQSKTAGTSLVISPSSKSLTVGRTVFVAFASDEVGTSYSCTDNLGNTYTEVANADNSTSTVKSKLFSAPVTTGGSVTSITISWTTNATAKAGVAAEYSNFGSNRLFDSPSAIGSNTVCNGPSSHTFFDGELWIGAHGVEDDVAPTVSGTSGTPAQTPVRAGNNGTTGGGSSTNISVSLVHFLISGNSSANATLTSTLSGTQVRAGCGGIYNAASAGTAEKNFLTLLGAGA